MATDELRAAAERIVDGYEEVCRVMTPHADNCAEKSTDKAVMLAVNYLAEHYADDEEPISEEWLKSTGFCEWDEAEVATDYEAYDLWIPMSDELGSKCRLAYVVNGFYAVRLDGESQFVSESVELLGTRNMKPAVTKGCVRRLCCALGITLKGKP